MQNINGSLGRRPVAAPLASPPGTPLQLKMYIINDNTLLPFPFLLTFSLFGPFRGKPCTLPPSQGQAEAYVCRMPFLLFHCCLFFTFGHALEINLNGIHFLAPIRTSVICTPFPYVFHPYIFCMSFICTSFFARHVSPRLLSATL